MTVTTTRLVLAGSLLLGLAACGNPFASNSGGQQPQQFVNSGSPAPGASMAAPVAPGVPGAQASPAPGQQSASNVDFGDDASRYSRDGECDDKRFSGPGMTDTPLLESDVGHDATDCRTAYNQGRLTYGGSAPSSAPGTYAASGVDHIIWGDDSSKYARDGECDDKRFSGPGMTDTPLLDSDIKHDASDCRSAYQQGRLQLAQ